MTRKEVYEHVTHETPKGTVVRLAGGDTAILLGMTAVNQRTGDVLVLGKELEYEIVSRPDPPTSIAF